MKCDVCNMTMKEGKATQARPYRYQMSGLDNLFLVGIDTFTCPRCRTTVPVIPKLGVLHAKIAEQLAEKPAPLTGKEGRFLRKHAGISSQKFARLVGLSAEHLSRFENGKQETLAPPADRFLRLVAVCANGGRVGMDLIDRIVDQIEAKTASSELTFEHEKKAGWRAAA
jgi:DNA-binding transcriptional regulator YiaG